MTPDIFGATDVGQKRKGNEDQFLVADMRKTLAITGSSLSKAKAARLVGESSAKLLIVADGMGGAAAGEIASRMVVEALMRYAVGSMEWYRAEDKVEEDEIAQDFMDALRQCKRRMLKIAEKHPEVRGMGTTLTMAYIQWPDAYIVHVGDSRCYLLRRGKLELVTRDHTVARRLLDEGKVTAEQVSGSRMGGLLWNTVSADGALELKPDVTVCTLAEGDTLLLCSDGLTKHVTDAELAERMTDATDAEALTNQLIQTCNERGGLDNITIVTARFPD